MFFTTAVITKLFRLPFILFSYSLFTSVNLSELNKKVKKTSSIVDSKTSYKFINKTFDIPKPAYKRIRITGELVFLQVV